MPVGRRLKIAVVYCTLFSGFVAYSNLFCAEFHADCSHHCRDASAHRTAERLIQKNSHDPFHALYHYNQLVEDASFNPSPDCAAWLFPPPISDRNSALLDRLPRRNVALEMLVFISSKSHPDFSVQLLI